MSVRLALFSSPITVALPLVALVACWPGAGSALDIALVNDDGWSAPGLRVLRETFEGAGHRVTLAAPAAQQSGSSAALDFRELRIRHESSNQYSVQVCRDAGCEILDSAEPATCALIAVDIATRRAGGRRPDLLLSGINPGANAGAASQISGTVGAAIAAASHVLGGGVPAIAISTELPPGCKGDADCALAHYRRAADFMLRLVGGLERQAARHGEAGRLLPAGIALNVNHPATEPRGVRIAGQGHGIVQNGRLSVLPIGCAGCVNLAVGSSAAGGPLPAVADTEPERPSADTVDLLNGYVTIVPMRADYTDENWQRMRRLIGKEALTAPTPTTADGD
jgi:5'-nucleotidase